MYIRQNEWFVDEVIAVCLRTQIFVVMRQIFYEQVKAMMAIKARCLREKFRLTESHTDVEVVKLVELWVS